MRSQTVHRALRLLRNDPRERRESNVHSAVPETGFDRGKEREREGEREREEGREREREREREKERRQRGGWERETASVLLCTTTLPMIGMCTVTIYTNIKIS